MRARLLRSWPSLSYHFGLMPWQVGRLTAPELQGYLDALEEIADAQEG